MRDELRRDLTAAMKARDAVAVRALRSALAAIGNAEAVDAPAGPAPLTAGEHVAAAAVGLGAAEADRRVLTDAQERDIVRAERDDRLSAAQLYEGGGHADRAASLRGEAAVLDRYLAGR